MSLIIPANTLAAGGYAVDNSVRFDDGSSSYLQKSASSGNRRTFTFSTWLKRSNLTSGNPSYYHTFFSSDQAAENSFRFTFNDDSGTDDDKLMVYYYTGSHQLKFITNRLFRDVSAWYHIVLAVDTTQGTDTNRVKIYVNGVQETSFSTASYPSHNLDTSVNQSGAPTRVGAGTDLYFDGYMAETVLIDGTAYAASDFGEFDEDSGIWKPIDVSGLTFGTNGFYLNYQDSAELGTDANGGTALAETNLTAIDQTTDTPTNNFATLNPLNQISSVAYSEGNLKFTNSSGTNRLAFANFVMTQGKWYCEMKITEHNTNYTHIGLRNIGSYTLTNAYVNDPTNEKVSYVNGGGTSSAGRVFIHGGTETDNMPSYTSGDIIGMACDMDNGYLYYHKNGTYINSGNPASGASGTGGFDIYNHGTIDYCFAVSNKDGGTDPVIDANFGNAPYAISSGNTDGNGYGNFEYAPPSGYLSLCTSNLSEVLG